MSTDAFRPFLHAVLAGDPLDADQAEAAMGLLLKGGVEPVCASAFLAGLKVRGEQPAEIVGAAKAMRAAAHRITAPAGAVDTCGTGGDGAETVNISTATALVLAACGVPVAKHGNRAVSSKSGSSDVLTALGVPVDQGPAHAEACLHAVGIAFLFAPHHHPAVAHIAPVRQALKVRTLFNLLGPLTNPAGATRQLLGVYDRRLVRPIADVLKDLGADAAIVAHGSDGLDEITVTGPTYLAILKDGEVTDAMVEPGDAGLPTHPGDALKGGSPAKNAEALLAVLEGKPGAYRDAVLLNTAAGLMVGGKAQGWAEGASLASAAIDSGAARALLTRFSDFRPA